MSTTKIHRDVIIDAMREAILDLSFFPERIIIPIPHANEFDFLPTFIESFDVDRDWPNVLGYPYSAALVDYDRRTKIANYEVTRL
jgi:hypothetical protein